MTALPGTRTLRQRAAFLFLALGGVLLARTVANDWPHEQTLIFRLEGELARTPLRLDTSVTRAGEGEASAGMSIERSGTEGANPRQTLRVPDGEYVVTVAWEERKREGRAAPKEGETSSVHRVTLEGGEVVVSVKPRVSE
ncbi:MAG TPA: hypothetical protein VGK73_15025 [Polyangiaceae bacterium]